MVERRRRLLLILGFSILVFVVVSTCVLLLNNPKYSSKKRLGKIHYPFFQFFVETNETRFGYKVFDKRIKDPIYRFGKSKKGESFLAIYPTPLSDYSTDEYECTGTCRCSDSERRVAGVFRPLFIMISAISTAVALTTSKIYFSNECERECSGIAAGAATFVADCVKKMNPFNKSYRWKCKGTCKENDGLVLEEHIKQSREFLCDLLDLEEEVVALEINEAIDNFEKAELFPFCDFISPYRQDPADELFDDIDGISHPSLCTSDRESISCYKTLTNLDIAPVAPS